MPINVAYGPAGAYGAAAQEVGGADEIMKNRQLAAQTVQQNRALAAQQLNSMISAVMQGRAIDAQQQSADSHTNAQQFATQMGYNAQQEHGAAQVVGQQRQQAFQGQQAANQYRQQYALENMRQEGRTERADMRVQSQAELMAMKLSAPEQMDMRQREANQAIADQKLSAGIWTPEEHQAFSLQNTGPLQAYRRRAAGYQQGLQMQGQQEQQQAAQRAGQLAVENFHARIIPNMQDGNGGPMYLDQHNVPQSLYQPSLNGQQIAALYTQAATDLTRSVREPVMGPNGQPALDANGQPRTEARTITPTPEEIEAEVLRRAEGVRRISRALVADQMRPQQPAQAPPPPGFTQREAPPPLDGLALGTNDRPHRDYDRAREPIYQQAMADIVRSPGMPDQPEAMQMVQSMQRLERMYGTVGNMPPRIAMQYAQFEANLQRMDAAIRQREQGRAHILEPTPTPTPRAEARPILQGIREAPAGIWSAVTEDLPANASALWEAGRRGEWGRLLGIRPPE